MKKILFFPALSIILLLSVLSLHGQVIITSENMPDQGDTIRVSEASYPLEGILDPSVTGFNFSWNYSDLQPVSQRVLNFISPTQTPFLYQIIFNSSVTNLASPMEGLDFFDVQVSDAFEFYKNTSGQFVRAGYAATIMGLPVPMKFDVPERLYKFPLSVNSEPDSSTSQLEIQYPSVAYFHLYKKRVNSVDGSGTLVTPFGTFSTLRMKSVIYEKDSLYIDSLQTGVPIVRNITEYKWLSPAFEAPLLTITQEGLFYSVQYMDFARYIIPFSVNLGDDITICQGDSVVLTANVEGGSAPYTYLWNTMETTSSITVIPQETTTYTVTVADDNGNFIFDEIQIVVIPFDRISLGNDTTVCAEHSLNFEITGTYNEISWYVDDVLKGTGSAFSIDSTGIGLKTAVLRIEYRQNNCLGSDEMEVTFHTCDAIPEKNIYSISVNPVPAIDKVNITISSAFAAPVVTILNASGTKVPVNYSFMNGRITVDISNLLNGVYFIRIDDGDKVYAGKFIKS